MLFKYGIQGKVFQPPAMTFLEFQIGLLLGPTCMISEPGPGQADQFSGGKRGYGVISMECFLQPGFTTKPADIDQPGVAGIDRGALVRRCVFIADTVDRQHLPQGETGIRQKPGKAVGVFAQRTVRAGQGCGM